MKDEFPLFDKIAHEIADLTIAHVNIHASKIRMSPEASENESTFPYKGQLLLEKVIQLLSEKV